MALMTNPSHFINKTLQNVLFIHHVDRSQLQLGDSSFAFRIYHGSYTLKDIRINSSALFQILKCCRRQHPQEPPVHQLLKWEMSLTLSKHNHEGTDSRSTGKFTHFMQNHKYLFSLHGHKFTLQRFYLQQPHCTHNSYKVTSSPGNILSASGD